MKKIAFLLAMLAVLLFAVSCGDETANEGMQNPNNDTQNNEENADKEPILQSEGVDVSKNTSGALVIGLNLPKAAGKDVSVVVVNSREATEGWAAEQVLAIEQISLDDKGVGQVTVTPRAAESYYVVVTYEGGKEITQVKS